MRSFLHPANLVLYAVAAAVGVGLHFFPVDPRGLTQRDFQLLLLIPIYALGFLAIELIAARGSGARRRVHLLGNPLAKRAMVCAAILIGLGVFVYTRFATIDNLSSQVAFSMVTCFFVGAAFEAFRLLRTEV